jgi:hypothetical protein
MTTQDKANSDEEACSCGECPECENRARAAESRRPLRSAALPDLKCIRDAADKIGTLHDRLQELVDGWDNSLLEWATHIENWRFSPESLVAEIVCDLMKHEIRAYVSAFPLFSVWGKDESGGVLRISEEWSDTFWTWFLVQPLAARVIRRARISITCCLPDTAEAECLKYIKEECIEWISQRNHEPRERT